MGWACWTEDQTEYLVDLWEYTTEHVRDMAKLLSEEYDTTFQRKDVIMQLWALEESKEIVITGFERESRLALTDKDKIES